MWWIFLEMFAGRRFAHLRARARANDASRKSRAAVRQRFPAAVRARDALAICMAHGTGGG